MAGRRRRQPANRLARTHPCRRPAAFRNEHRHRRQYLALGRRRTSARLENHPAHRRGARLVPLFPACPAVALWRPGAGIRPGLCAARLAGVHLLRGVRSRPGLIGLRGRPDRRASRAVVRAGLLRAVGRADRFGHGLRHADGGGHRRRHREFGFPSRRLFHHQPSHHRAPPGPRVLDARADRQPGLGAHARVHHDHHAAGQLARGGL